MMALSLVSEVHVTYVFIGGPEELELEVFNSLTVYVSD